jgi:hypothetical protein
MDVARMTLLDSWMPAYDVSARYAIDIDASPDHVYATLLASDFSRPWLVRGLMGLRLLPKAILSPRVTWQRLRQAPRSRRASLRDIGHSDFILLEEAPPREIVLGISGRFWTLAADIVRIPPEHFREPLAAGLAQAVWNFDVSPAGAGASLSTETRIRCADAQTLRAFRRYWRLVAPGSGLIRHAILNQVRREATPGADPTRG